MSKLETFMILFFVVAPVLFLGWLCFMVYGPFFCEMIKRWWRK